MDSSDSEYAAVTVSFKHGNERSGFIKCGNNLDKMRCFEILKKESAPLSWTVYQVKERTLLLAGRYVTTHQWQRYHFYGTSDLEIEVRLLHPFYVGRCPLSEHDVQHIPLRSRYLTAQYVPYEHPVARARHSPYRRFRHQETRLWHS